MLNELLFFHFNSKANIATCIFSDNCQEQQS